VTKRSAPSRRDTGAVLPLAMVVVTVLSLVVVALLNLTTANLRVVTVTRDHVDDLYARDAGVEYGLSRIDSQIAGNSSMCGSETSTAALPVGTTTVNDTTVSVACKVIANGALGGGGQDEPFLYLTGLSASSKSEGFFYFDETEGGTINVDAKVYNAGRFHLKNAAGSIVDFGRSIEQHAPVCQKNARPDRLAHSGSTWDCKHPITDYPKNPMPTMWVPASSRPASITTGGCRYFFPGRYSTAPSMSSSTTNYFASGVYYFTSGVGTFDVANVVIGGQRGTETEQFPRPACATDAAAWTARGVADPDTSDTGVAFIFAGDAAIKIPSNPSNRLDLFTYRPGASTLPGPAALSGYSIIAPTASGSNAADGGGSWAAHTKSILLETDSAEPGLISVHGLVFAPKNHLKLRLMTNSASSIEESYMFAAGLVIASVELITSGLPSSKEIHFAGGAGGKEPAIIMVEAHSAATGRRSVATIKYDPTDVPKVAVLSWRATDDP
jgi:hypothetical protein